MQICIYVDCTLSVTLSVNKIHRLEKRAVRQITTSSTRRLVAGPEPRRTRFGNNSNVEGAS